MIVHAVGQATEVDKIVEVAHERGIKVVEDCARRTAPSSRKRVGTFGDIAAFSTMYRKAHMTGPSGGVVYTRNLELHRKALAHADRGKPRWREDFSDRDPSTYLFPALNHNTDEISCAIGVASLGAARSTIMSRLAFVSDVVARLVDASECLPALSVLADEFAVLLSGDRRLRRHHLQQDRIRRSGARRGHRSQSALQIRGTEWPYIRPYLADDFDAPNAHEICDRSFNLYLNENYGEREARDIVKAISKVEKHFAEA